MRNALDSIFIVLAALCFGAAASAQGIESDNERDALARVVAQLEERADLRLIESSPDRTVSQFRVPLGAMQKVRGVWAPEYAVRVSGRHRSWTWRLEEGFSAGEVLADIETVLALMGATTLAAKTADKNTEKDAQKDAEKGVEKGVEKGIETEWLVFTAVMHVLVAVARNGQIVYSASGCSTVRKPHSVIVFMW